MRYIELNPVRAKLVDNPADYAWSSYRHNGHGRNDSLIAPHSLYLALGTDITTRCEAYGALYTAHVETSLLGTIRDALNKELVLGNERFGKQIEVKTSRQTTPRPLGQPSRDSDVGVY